MPEPANSYAKLPSQRKMIYDRTLLERILPYLVFLEHGMKSDHKSQPKNEGDMVEWRRFNSLPIPSESLTEGITPAGRNLSISRITAAVKQEGDFVTLTDLLDLLGIDPVIIETTELISEQAALTLETRIRDIVFNGTNVWYVGGGINRAAVGAANVLTGTEARRLRQIMARNNVKPIGNEYIGFTHPDCAFDMKGSAEWLAAHLYGSPENLFTGEVGKLHNIRWIETTMCPVWIGQGNGGVDVYGSMVLGQNAYGVVDIAGSAKPEVIVKQLGSSGVGDPLDQRSSVGWKALMTAVRLQELAMIRVETASGI